MNPDEAELEIARALPELRREFDASQDDLGICRTLQLEAALHWNHCRSGAAEYAWLRAADYARKVNDRRQLADIVGWLASAALWGPTPAPEGIQRCQDYLDEIGNHPIGKAGILLNLAGLYAMQDDFAAAQETLNTAKSMLETLGPTMTAAITQPAALIAMLGRRSSDRREVPSARIRLPLPDGRAALPGHHRGDIWPEPSRRKGRAGTTRPFD